MRLFQYLVSLSFEQFETLSDLQDLEVGHSGTSFRVQNNRLSLLREVLLVPPVERCSPRREVGRITMVQCTWDLSADSVESNRAVKPTTQDILRLFMDLKTLRINIVKPKCLYNKKNQYQLAWSMLEVCLLISS